MTALASGGSVVVVVGDDPQRLTKIAADEMVELPPGASGGLSGRRTPETS